MPIQVIGQTNLIRQLKQQLAEAKDPITKLELTNQLSIWYCQYDLELAEKSTLEGMLMAESAPGKAASYWALAARSYYLYNNGQLESARNLLNQLKNLTPVNQNDLMCFVTITQGNLLLELGQYDSARRYFNVASRYKPSAPALTSYLMESKIQLLLTLDYPDSAITMADEAITLAKNSGDSLLMTKGILLKITALEENGEYNEAKPLLTGVKDQSTNEPILIGKYLFLSGIIYNISGEFNDALKTWSLYLNTYAKKQNQYKLVYLLFNMGTAFENLGYYDLAIEYLGNGISIARKSGYKHLIADLYHEQSWVYYRNKDFQTAIDLSRISLQIFRTLNQELDMAGCYDLLGLANRNLGHLDSSLYFHNKSLAGRLKLAKKVDISASYFNIGEFYLNAMAYREALPFYRKSFRIDSSIGDKYGLSLNYNRMGKIFTKLNVFDSAYYFLDLASKLAIPVSSNEVFKDTYLNFAEYYELSGDPVKAIEYYKKYNGMADSLFVKQTAQSLAAYRALFDIEKNQQKLEILNLEAERDKAIIQKQNIYVALLIAGIVLTLVVIATVFGLYKRLKKLNTDLAEKNEEIQAQTEELQETNDALYKLNNEVTKQKEMIESQAKELLESNKLITQTNEMLEGRVESRTHELRQAFKELDTFFYRSSHDFRRPLTTFMGLAEVAKILVKDNLALELFAKVNENARTLDKMLRKLQSISDVGTQENIYKEISFDNLIEVELEKFRDEIESRKFTIIVTSEITRKVQSYSALIAIIFENLIENALSFSTDESPHLHVSVRNSNIEEEVTIEFADNGPGIDPGLQERVFEMYFRGSEQSKGNGLGLYIVKKTVQKVQGRIELQSEPGKGTTIKIHLPLKIT